MEIRQPAYPVGQSELAAHACFRSAVSSGCCTEDLGEGLAGSLPCQGLTWPGVEAEGDLVAVGLSEVAHVAALGPVLAQQAVGRSYVCQAAAASVGWSVRAGSVAACMQR